jgi:hypothetical protein
MQEEDFEDIEDIGETKELASKPYSKSILGSKMITIELRLGDIIQITTDYSSNKNQYYIEYINKKIIRAIEVESLEKIDFTIDEQYELVYNGVKIDGKITLIYRQKEEGFARQNGLFINTWISILFEIDTERREIIGQVVELPEDLDMITILTYPKKETLYINFEYKGLSQHLHISSLKIISSPYTDEEYFDMVPNINEEEAVDIDNLDDDNDNQNDIRRSPPIFEFDKIIPLGKVADVVYLVNADESQFRYDLDTQKNDLLNSMLSKIPKSQRTTDELSSIALIIERFRQLRQQFSVFDDFGNITSSTQKGARWKPLVENLKTFSRSLYWIIPVATQTKMLYLAPNDEDSDVDVDDSAIETINANASAVQNLHKNVEIDTTDIDNPLNVIIQEFKRSSMSDNRYIKFLQQIYKYFMPYRYNIQRSNILTRIPVTVQNMNVVINNDGDMRSNVTDISVKKQKSAKQVLYDIKEKNYITGVYLPDDKVLHATKFTSDIRMTVQREKVHNTMDHIDLVSILTLPEVVIQFSRVNLPGTNIMNKSEMGQTFIDFSEIFKKTENYDSLIKTISLQNLDNEDAVAELQRLYDTTDFIGKKKMTNYVTNTTIDTENNKTIYETYLNLIIPQSKVLFNLIKKNVNGRMSIMNVISYLEPFLIYQDDVTFKFYEVLKYFVENKCRDYKRQLRDKNNDFNALKESLSTMNKSSLFVKSKCCKLANLIDIDKEDAMEIYNLYGLPEMKIETVDKVDNIHPTSSELLHYFTKVDFHRMFSYRIIDVSLLVHKNTDEMIRLQEERIDTWNDSGDCEKKYVIAKVYNNETDLKADDGKSPIYFDRRLNSGQTCDRDITVNEIADGDMAALYNAGGDSFKYYRRTNDHWKEEDIDASVFSGDFICGLKERCIQDARDGSSCISMDIARMNITKKNIDNVLEEFDRSIELQTSELREHIEKNFQYYKEVLPKLIRIDRNKQYGKYEYRKYELGVEMKTELRTEDEVISSPYLKLRDIILGQSSFDKQQRDIIMFKELFTLSVNTSTDTDAEYWFFCNKTNTKLLPKFLFVLADTFINDNDNYTDTIEYLCKSQGKISDDGDSWVDKYSGYIIRKIDYDVEEGYENGFKASSRARLEGESASTIEEEITNTTADIQTQTSDRPSYMKYIYYKVIIHVIDTLMRALKVSLDDYTQNDFIANIVFQLLSKVLYSKEQFIKTHEKKGKTYGVDEYTKYVNKNIIFFTMMTFILALQTNIPIVKINSKTYTMNEYPLEADGSKETFQYIIQLILSLKTLQGTPWNIIFNKSKTMTRDKFIENLESVRGQVISQELVEHRKTIKINGIVALIDNKDDEYNISKWTQFLPPLFDINMRRDIDNISGEFKSGLVERIRSGDISQYDQINVLKGKIILFSLGIVFSIQQVISREILLLESNSGKYYLENACCISEKQGESVIQYFSKENRNIDKYIENAISAGNILHDIRAMTISPMLFCKNNSKDVYLAINSEFNEQTIYAAFIVYCHFQSLKPLNDQLKILCHCKQKPVAFDINDSLRQKIDKIKESGKHYTNEDLVKLLKYIGENNMIQLYINREDTLLNPYQNMKNILYGKVKEEYELITLGKRDRDFGDEIDGTPGDDEVLPPILDNISRWLEKINLSNVYEPISSSDRSKMIDDIMSSNTSLKNKIFAKNMSKRDNIDIQSKFNSLFLIMDEGQTLHNSVVFIKHYIYFISRVFPKMMIDYKFDKPSSNIFSNILPVNAKSLSLSDSSVILKMTEKHYEPLVKFYQKYEADLFIIRQTDGNDCGSWFCNMLNKVKERTSPIITLMENTPILSNIYEGKEKTMPILEEHTILALLEYYILNIFNTYIELFSETFQEDNKLMI